jgi:hypothetical protein
VITLDYRPVSEILGEQPIERDETAPLVSRVPR